MRFLKANIKALIFLISELAIEFWFAVIAAESMELFIILIGSNIVLGLLALSPIGEGIQRLTSPIRNFNTEAEQSLIYPVIEEVYMSAVADNPKMDRKIGFFMEDSMAINAYAMGRRTVVFTKGILDVMDEAELKGITAHELGHILNGDTKFALVVLSSNIVFQIVLLFFKVVGLFFGFLLRLLATNVPLMDKVVYLFFKLVQLILLGVKVLIASILASNSRGNEFGADSYARRIGYGDELASALHKLQQMDFTKMSLLERLLSSHPHLSLRIGRLEAEEVELEEVKKEPLIKKVERFAPAPATSLTGTVPILVPPVLKTPPPKPLSRTNRVMVLGNGRRYYVLRHEVYEGDNYYLVAGIEENNLNDEYGLFHEVISGGESYVELEENPRIWDSIEAGG